MRSSAGTAPVDALMADAIACRIVVVFSRIVHEVDKVRERCHRREIEVNASKQEFKTIVL
jgi:alpha-D-ribose 1-methylphosphonate 5-triphosphate synthase subunit PhnG